MRIEWTKRRDEATEMEGVATRRARMRGGQDRKKMFYPVLIDVERGAVVGAGAPLPLRTSLILSRGRRIYGCLACPEGQVLGSWGSTSNTSPAHKQGYVALGEIDEKRNTWPLSYLSEEPQAQILSGVLEIISRDEVRNVVEVQYTEAGNSPHENRLASRTA